MLIKSTKNASVNRLKGVILAPSGNGKTYLASTTGEPTLLISVESGHLTLNDFDIDMIDVTVEDDGKGGSTLLTDKQRYEKLLSVFEFLKSPEARKKYKCVYLDGITEIGNVAIRMLEQDKYWGQSKMTMPRYGEYTKIMNAIILLYRDLPYYNIWFTSLVEEKVDKDDKGNVTKRYPATVLMPGSKIPENIPAFFDEVLYLGVKHEADGSKKRYILTQETAHAFAKDRSGKLDKYEQPNLAEIANKIRGIKGTKGEKK